MKVPCRCRDSNGVLRIFTSAIGLLLRGLFKRLLYNFFSGASKIQEINSGALKTASASKSPLIVELDRKDQPEDNRKRPKFAMFKDVRANKFTAKIQLPELTSGRDVVLDVGEDRLVVSADKYLLDIFLPLKLDGARTQARFLRDKRVLEVETPIAA